MRPHPTTTGLPPHQFDNLVQQAARHDTANQLDNPFPRPPSVCVETAVLMTVLATRNNLVQTVLAGIFAVSQPTVSRVLAWGRRVLPTLIEPAVVTIDDVGPHERVLADGTLTPTGNRTGHDGLYSGKRHAAGVGLQVVSNRWGRLIDVAGPVPGATHDARAWFDLGLARAACRSGRAHRFGISGVQRWCYRLHGDHSDPETSRQGPVVGAADRSTGRSVCECPAP